MSGVCEGRAHCARLSSEGWGDVSGLTAEQKALRRTGIGSSEIAAVLGLSPYAGPLDVYRAKVEGLEFEETDVMRRGRHVEGAVAEWYAEETGATVQSVGTLVSATNSRVLATPDRFATFTPGPGRPDGETRTLEVKTARWSMLSQWGEAGSADVPQHYALQVAWELAVTQHERADVAVLFGGDDFRIYHLARDLELEGMLLEAGAKFLRDHVDPQRPPPVDGSKGSADWLAKRFPKAGPALLPATAAVNEWVAQLRVNLETMAKAKHHAEAAKASLKAIIGDAAGVEGDFGRITWKNEKHGKTAWKALALKLGASPAQIAEHTGQPGRRFHHPFRFGDAAEEE